MLNNNEIMELINLSISISVANFNRVKNGRYKSWEYCYLSFIKSRNSKDLPPDYDVLSLHLAFYLASWGMYRGSSFLLQRDYKIHIPVVTELLKSDYNNLAGINWTCSSKCKQEFVKLENLKKFINDYYASVRKEIAINLINNKDVSEVLITKILMGTLGCVPAYDRYFKSGIKYLKVSSGTYNRNSIEKLVSFWMNNRDKFERIRNSLPLLDNGDVTYPQMKLIDIGFWCIGYALELWKLNNHEKELPQLTFNFIKEILENCKF